MLLHGHATPADDASAALTAARDAAWLQRRRAARHPERSSITRRQGGLALQAARRLRREPTRDAASGAREAGAQRQQARSPSRRPATSCSPPCMGRRRRAGDSSKLHLDPLVAGGRIGSDTLGTARGSGEEAVGSRGVGARPRRRYQVRPRRCLTPHAIRGVSAGGRPCGAEPEATGSAPQVDVAPRTERTLLPPESARLGLALAACSLPDRSGVRR